MNATLSASVNALSTVGEDTVAQRGHRVVLVGLEAFRWIRRLQEQAPAPRMDMRYLVEGALVVVRDGPQGLRQAWLLASEQAMAAHVAGKRAASLQPSAPPAMHQVRAGDRAAAHESATVAAMAAETGTAAAAAAEGAAARTQGSHLSTHKARLSDCKALQIGTDAFEWLQAVQRTTRDPRLEFRYLLEGLCALLQARTDLLHAVVGHARQALATHLSQLAGQPISISLSQQEQPT